MPSAPPSFWSTPEERDAFLESWRRAHPDRKTAHLTRLRVRWPEVADDLAALEAHRPDAGPDDGMCGGVAAPVRPDAMLRTCQYVYGQGGGRLILVGIDRGVLHTFAPVANPGYVFAMGGRATPFYWVDDRGRRSTDWPAYYARKRAALRCRAERVLPPHRWWRNGHVVCNELPTSVWGETNTEGLRDMMGALAAERLTDGAYEAILNKRDLPLVRSDGRAPQWDCCPEEAVGGGSRCVLPPEARAPVFSFYTGAAFADLPLPTVEDWARASGRVFAPAVDYRAEPSLPRPPWDKRLDAAVFRGSATGAGVTPADNLRLALCERFAKVPRVPGRPHVDAGIVAWSMRDQVDGRGRVTHQVPDAMGFALSPKMGFEDQLRFKFQVYVEGHAGASRLSANLGSGAVVLWLRWRDDDDVDAAGGTPAPRLWYQPLLTGEEYRVVTLDTLVPTMEHLLAHPKEAAAIVGKATAFYRDVICSREALLDHLAAGFRARAAAPTRRRGPFGMASTAYTRVPPPASAGFKLPFGGEA